MCGGGEERRLWAKGCVEEVEGRGMGGRGTMGVDRESDPVREMRERDYAERVGWGGGGCGGGGGGLEKGMCGGCGGERADWDDQGVESNVGL